MNLVFIAVDGLDGCGKDTHASRIKKALESQGQEVILISHPSTRTFGRLSKRFLQGSGSAERLLATLFYIADVLQSVSRYGRKRRENVIFVRYLLGAAYLPASLAPAGYRFFRNLLPFPDLALFIDIEPEVARRRIAARGHQPEMFETYERLSSVRRVAKQIVSEEWVTVDNSEDGEGPFKEVARILTELSILGPAV